ncbi:MAG: lactate racemase domain-containing protein [Planctomycetaceae bacterium]
MSLSPPLMSDDDVRTWLADHVSAADFAGKRVLLIVPDATRTAPMPLLFGGLHAQLQPVVKRLDVLVALGTHPPMSDDDIAGLLGISPCERETRFAEVGLFNHEWDKLERLTKIGTLTARDTGDISGGLLQQDVPVTINCRIRDYDLLLVLGPVFPHEVAGFSGGNKYFFPGISGPELLNFFHWLGALITNAEIIGVKETPVRRVVDRAAAMIPIERRCIAFVVSPDARLYGLSYGTPEDAWSVAADLSARVHVTRVSKPYEMVVSCAPPMYDELWVAGKCMYKLEPVVADDGELIIFAPHLNEISVTHGALIERVGYHVRDYFTRQWDRFRNVPWGVLAHSTHVRGGGTFEDGVERPRVQVTLATAIPPDVCKRINLGYKNPATIDIESFADREEEGILLVRKAGEQLYRLQ